MTAFNVLDKNSQDSVKDLATEYITLKMSAWLFEKEDYNSLQEFNEKNSIDTTKFLLYPFFICIANGSFDLLYDLLSPFYAMKHGPVSSVALNLTWKNNMKYFDLSNNQNFNIRLRNLDNDWIFMIDQLKLISLTLEDGSNDTFHNINYDSDTKTIISSIDSSFDAIKKQTDNRFILYNNYQVITLARQHRSWSTIYNYYSALSGSKLADFQIPKSEAQKDRKVFKSLEELGV